MALTSKRNYVLFGENNWIFKSANIYKKPPNIEEWYVFSRKGSPYEECYLYFLENMSEEDRTNVIANDRTAVTAAVRRGYYNIITLLAKYGFSYYTNSYYTAASLAAKLGSRKLLHHISREFKLYLGYIEGRLFDTNRIRDRILNNKNTVKLHQWIHKRKDKMMDTLLLDIREDTFRIDLVRSVLATVKDCDCAITKHKRFLYDAANGKIEKIRDNLEYYKPNALYLAAINGHVDVVKYILTNVASSIDKGLMDDIIELVHKHNSAHLLYGKYDTVKYLETLYTDNH
tara:strand:- start:819 stop:1679 length:861 start_codon:yes stop_codon:yes gene_type:complete